MKSQLRKMLLIVRNISKKSKLLETFNFSRNCEMSHCKKSHNYDFLALNSI